jgi:hypothetical protein
VRNYSVELAEHDSADRIPGLKGTTRGARRVG